MQLIGTWLDRTALYDKQWLYDRTAALKAANRKRNKGLPFKQRKRFRGKPRKRPNIKDFTEKIALIFSPIPCWDGLSKKELRAKAAAMNESVKSEHRERIKRLPKDWRKRLMDKTRFAQRPTKRRPASVRPKVHAASKEAWIIWIKTWESWIDRYDKASARLRQGLKEALEEFPAGSFVPSGIYRPTLATGPPH